MSKNSITIESESNTSSQVALERLKDRILSTRKSRIEASKRLRTRHHYFEKITHFYSLILLVLSIWFLGKDGPEEANATKVLLILSLSLTYFTMFLNLKNYKERAGNFETNYQELDVLINKIDRYEAGDEIVTQGKFKEFQREYEKLIIGKENHLNIDFFVSTKDNRSTFKDDIKWFQMKERLVNICVAFYPLLIVVIILLADYLLDYLR